VNCKKDRIFLELSIIFEQIFNFFFDCLVVTLKSPLLFQNERFLNISFFFINSISTPKNSLISGTPLVFHIGLPFFDQVFFDFVPIYICFHCSTFAFATFPISTDIPAQNSSNSVDLFVVRTKA